MKGTNARMFSVLILTKDEESNIKGCLDSVSWCDDVVVLDSFSADRTCEVARENGARVFQRAFDDFGAQRNFALEHVEFKNRWVFHLDADERFNPSLRDECEAAIASGSHSAYFVANRLIFMGRWIRHSSQYPYPQVRLVKIGEARFAKSGHGQREASALRGTGYLRTPYDHFNFSKGIADWVDRHNRYSSERLRKRQPCVESCLLRRDVCIRSADAEARPQAAACAAAGAGSANSSICMFGRAGSSTGIPDSPIAC